jgi:hypothetical protein
MVWGIKIMNFVLIFSPLFDKVLKVYRFKYTASRIPYKACALMPYHLYEIDSIQPNGLMPYSRVARDFILRRAQIPCRAEHGFHTASRIPYSRVARDSIQGLRLDAIPSL